MKTRAWSLGHVGVVDGDLAAGRPADGDLVAERVAAASLVGRFDDDELGHGPLRLPRRGLLALPARPALAPGAAGGRRTCGGPASRISAHTARSDPEEEEVEQREQAELQDEEQLLGHSAAKTTGARGPDLARRGRRRASGGLEQHPGVAEGQLVAVVQLVLG